MKNLYCNFFVCSNRHSDMKSLNVNHVADYNLGLLLLLNPIFISFLGNISLLNMLGRDLLITDAG